MADTLDQDIDGESAPIYSGPMVQVTVILPGLQGAFTDLLVPVVKDGQLPFSEVGGHVFLRTVSSDLIAVRHIVRISGLDAAVRECKGAAVLEERTTETPDNGTEDRGIGCWPPVEDESQRAAVGYNGGE